MEDRTMFTRASLPDLLSNLPFHAGSFAAILSMTGWISLFDSFLMLNGRPKYLHGKLLTAQGKGYMISARSSPSHWIGYTAHLSKFVCRPDVLPKICSRSPTTFISSFTGLTKMTASSAYMLTRSFIAL
uniref:Uncharacterized protein n=1 Tax=Arundo donax TaxID=35708 RepID=A0A0A9BKW6_ARUDO